MNRPFKNEIVTVISNDTMEEVVTGRLVSYNSNLITIGTQVGGKLVTLESKYHHFKGYPVPDLLLRSNKPSRFNAMKDALDEIDYLTFLVYNMQKDFSSIKRLVDNYGSGDICETVSNTAKTWEDLPERINGCNDDKFKNNYRLRSKMYYGE